MEYLFGLVSRKQLVHNFVFFKLTKDLYDYQCPYCFTVTPVIRKIYEIQNSFDYEKQTTLDGIAEDILSTQDINISFKAFAAELIYMDHKSNGYMIAILYIAAKVAEHLVLNGKADTIQDIIDILHSALTSNQSCQQWIKSTFVVGGMMAVIGISLATQLSLFTS